MEQYSSSSQKNEIILYQPDNTIQLEVMVKNDTVWLSLNQLTKLFLRDKSVISKHIKNIYLEEELNYEATVAKFATVQNENGRIVERQIEYYNLDVIISVGYRVKSKQGTRFRQWSNSVLKEYMLKGYAVTQRLERLEYRMTETEKNINFFVRANLPPIEGVFCNNQIFDAYKFASDLIKSAKKSIILIDNYIDESVLTLLSKRCDGVSATIYTANISQQLRLDLSKHNAQYAQIQILEKHNIHDRFLLVDNNLYHIGASLKDLGKRLFAFSKMEMTAFELLSEL
jgi:hypothetical protein